MMTTYPTEWEDCREEGCDDGRPLQEVAVEFGILPATLARWREKGATSLAPFPGPLVATQAAAAKLLNVNRRTLADWLSAGCPGEPGNYAVGMMAAWRREQPNPEKWSDPSIRRWKPQQGEATDCIRGALVISRWAMFTALCDALRTVRLAVPTMPPEEWAALEGSLSERLLSEAMSDQQIDRYIVENLGGHCDESDDADGEA